MPACASCAENMALREDSAAAKSFQLDRVPTRPWFIRGVAADRDADGVNNCSW